MAYSPHLMYGGSAPYNVYPQEESFQAFPSSRLDDAPFDLAMNIDPNLHVSPPIAFPSQWSSPMIQRFQNDPQKLALFNPVPPMHTMSASNLVRPVAPVPPPSQGRHGSPVSSHELSSCSSAQSPPGESEMFTDNNPPTPPDMALLSPFHSSRLDSWDAPPQYFQLTGVRTFPTETCVNMADVNPTQESYHEFESQSPMSLQRSFTYESQASSTFEADTVTIPTVDYLPMKRMSSPEEMQPAIKEEIHIVHPVPSHKVTKSAYPPPDADDEEDPDEEPAAIDPKIEEDDEDGDYKPGQKRHRRTSSNATRRGPKSRRQAAPRSIEKATPKRQRIGGASSQPAKILPPSPPGSKGSLFCGECSLNFKDQTGLDSHVKKQHTRPFVCVFNFAGCDSTFASKNEWKRHVSSQHLLLHYWLCNQEACYHTKNGPPRPSPPQAAGGKRSRARGQDSTINVASTPTLPDGAIFNRKDLYTQHLRRMHMPNHLKKSAKAGKKSSGSGTTSDWDERLRLLQQEAVRERCQLPTHMVCPAAGCKQTFNGTDAWDQRMEHVARHLEKAANGREAPVVFGGPTDHTLMQWCTNPAVGVVKRGADGAWELNNPLKPESGKDQRQSAATNSDPLIKNEIIVESGEEDAEGDEEY